MNHRTKLIAAAATVFAAGMLAPAPASADIFQWEYINPANPSQGKQQSTTLCPGGAGANAVPNAGLHYRNLTKAYLIGADLSGAKFLYANLTIADFSQANLTNAVFGSMDLADGTLTGATFTGAVVRGANFDESTSHGFTAAQLYSTASHQNHDLAGIGLSTNNLSGWNFAGQNLSNANFTFSSLTGANFAGAQVRGASFVATGLSAAQLYSTASYQNHDLAGISLQSINHSGWNFAGQDLSNANLQGDATNANFNQANLSNADLVGAVLAGANFTGAEVRGADMQLVTGWGFTAAQLYSTASYQNRDLTGIVLGGNDLTGWNFARQNLTEAYFAGKDFHGGVADLTNADLSHANLTNASLQGATLTNANFTGAEVRGTNFESTFGFTATQLYSTANYQRRDLSGINLHGQDLSGWDFAGQNLTNASFGFAYLTGTNFSGAEVRGANFISLNHNSGFTAAQLYSTASYKNHDLTGINLVANNMPGWNFSGQNLTGANFRVANLADADFSYANLTHAAFGIPFPANLTGANFSHANLANADIGVDNLTNTNFTGADTRGALILPDPTSITTNLIRYDGHVAGLGLTGGQSLLVRNYHGNPAQSPPIGPLPIVVDQSMAMDATGTLKLIFDADEWDSEISFAPGIPVSLGGTLELAFADGVDVNAQIGRTFQIFDWTGVTPIGSFNVASEFVWDISQLYSAGKVTLVPEPASFVPLILGGIASLTARRINQRRGNATQAR